MEITHLIRLTTTEWKLNKKQNNSPRSTKISSVYCISVCVCAAKLGLTGLLCIKLDEDHPDKSEKSDYVQLTDDVRGSLVRKCI